jgi:hypothetical protein
LTAEPAIIFGTFSLPGLGRAGGTEDHSKDDEQCRVLHWRSLSLGLVWTEQKSWGAAADRTDHGQNVLRSMLASLIAIQLKSASSSANFRETFRLGRQGFFPSVQLFLLTVEIPRIPSDIGGLFCAAPSW